MRLPRNMTGHKRLFYVQTKKIIPYEVQKLTIAEIANSIDPDEEVHNEPPHLGLHCLASKS